MKHRAEVREYVPGIFFIHQYAVAFAGQFIIRVADNAAVGVVDIDKVAFRVCLEVAVLDGLKNSAVFFLVPAEGPFDAFFFCDVACYPPYSRGCATFVPKQGGVYFHIYNGAVTVDLFQLKGCLYNGVVSGCRGGFQFFMKCPARDFS